MHQGLRSTQACREMATGIVLMLAWMAAGAAEAQLGGTFPSPQHSRGSISSPSRDDGPFGGNTESENPKLEQARHHAREVERQKRIVDDTAKLLALATQYQANMQAHGTATAEDARLLLEMERLARTVKDRMRGL